MAERKKEKPDKSREKPDKKNNPEWDKRDPNPDDQNEEQGMPVKEMPSKSHPHTEEILDYTLRQDFRTIIPEAGIYSFGFKSEPESR